MILDGFNSNPVDKIITVPGKQGPPGLDLSELTDIDGGTPSSTYGPLVVDGGGP
jgi:hypothetical protein